MQTAICPIAENRSLLQKPERHSGKESSLYPDDIELPWHFSWIDDRNIGGSSIPCERENIPALVRHGVGLLVNLTEMPLFPFAPTSCASCAYDGSQIYCKADLFDDLQETDELHILTLPIKDGHVPYPDQIQMFLKYSSEAVERGEKVIVHCMAGCGRTGVLLAIYLMNKYRLNPKEAIERLRAQRPSSMQYNPDDWASDPFLIRGREHYDRNILQERFIHYYYTEYLLPSWGSSPTNSQSSLSTLNLYASNIDTISVQSEFSIENFSDSESNHDMQHGAHPPKTKFVFVQQVSDSQVDLELRALMEKITAVAVGDQPRVGIKEYSESQHDMMVEETIGFDTLINSDVCLFCRGVLSIGPIKLGPVGNWNDIKKEIIYSERWI